MTCREYAAENGIPIIGSLRRMPDHFDPFRGKLYRWYMDEAGTEFHMDKVGGKWTCYFAITEDGEGV